VEQLQRPLMFAGDPVLVSSGAAVHFAPCAILGRICLLINAGGSVLELLS
jgi:hypothetical protein